MAKFTASVPLNLKWNGLDIQGAVGATHRIPDAYVEEFIDGPGRHIAGLTWITQDETSAIPALPLAQTDITGLTSSLASKFDKAGGIISGAVTATGAFVAQTSISTPALTASRGRFKGGPWHDVTAYGAVGDGATNDGAAFAAAVAAAESSNGLIHIPEGTYLVSSSWPILLNSALDKFTYVFRGTGKGTVISVSGMTGTQALFHGNLDANGQTVSSSFVAHPRVVFEDLVIDGSASSSATLFKGYQRSVELRRVTLRSMLYGASVDGYTDNCRVEQVDVASSRSGGYAFKLNAHGDGLVVDQLFCYGSGGLYLDRCAGGTIRGRVGGWDTFKRCQGIEYVGAHVEPTQAGLPPTAFLTIEGSQIAFRDCHFWTDMSKPVLYVNDDSNTEYRQKSDILLDHVQFVTNISAATTTVGVGIRLESFQAYSRLRLRDCSGMIFTSSGSTRWIFDPVGIKVTASNGTIQSTIDANPAALLGTQTELRRVRNTSTWELIDGAGGNVRSIRASSSTTSFGTTQASGNYPSNLSAGTYFYTYTVRGADGETEKATEASVTVTSNQSVLLTVGTNIGPAVIRIWRGTSTGTYDRYVDIATPVGNIEAFDMGGSVLGHPWITTSVPTPPTASSLFDGLTVPSGGRRIVFGSAAPTAGTWTRGDIVFNTAPSASGTVGWVCTTGGTPGTWKTFGAISA